MTLNHTNNNARLLSGQISGSFRKRYRSLIATRLLRNVVSSVLCQFHMMVSHNCIGFIWQYHICHDVLVKAVAVCKNRWNKAIAFTEYTVTCYVIIHCLYISHNAFYSITVITGRNGVLNRPTCMISSLIQSMRFYVRERRSWNLFLLLINVWSICPISWLNLLPITIH